jgi:hypothetical protein
MNKRNNHHLHKEEEMRKVIRRKDMGIKDLRNAVKDKNCIYNCAATLQKTALMIFIFIMVMILGHASYAGEALKPSMMKPGSVTQKVPTGKFNIVTKSFKVEPSQPLTGQSLTFKGTVKNEGDGPSPSDTPIFISCKALSGGPCQWAPSNVIAVHAPSLSPGDTYNFQEATPQTWLAGKYAFFAGNDVITGTNGMTVEVTVSPPPFPLPKYNSNIQQPTIPTPESLGQIKMLNPQPEPPLPTIQPPKPAPDPAIIPQQMPVVK